MLFPFKDSDKIELGYIATAPVDPKAIISDYLLRFFHWVLGFILSMQS